jgi:hypothetical protein
LGSRFLIPQTLPTNKVCRTQYIFYVKHFEPYLSYG